MDIFNLYTYQIVAIGIILVCLVYTLFFRKKIVDANVLTPDQIELLDYAVNTGFEMAEKVYDSKTPEERKKAALDYAFGVVKVSKMFDEKYLIFIRTVIEDQLNKKYW